MLLLLTESCSSDSDWYFKTGDYTGWKYIVIHHSATRSGNAKGFHKYHTDMGYGGLCYHYVIGNGRGAKDGDLYTGFRWKKQMAGTHCTINSWDYNIFGIGICLVGDFSRTKPTKKQMKTLMSLINKLRKKYKIPIKSIVGHKEVPLDDDPDKFEATTCPGKYLSVEKIREQLKKEDLLQ